MRTPREHGELLHAGGQGTVAISHKAHKRWNQTVYPVEVALALLDQYRGQDDVFLSTQRFRVSWRHLLADSLIPMLGCKGGSFELESLEG